MRQTSGWDGAGGVCVCVCVCRGGRPWAARALTSVQRVNLHALGPGRETVCPVQGCAARSQRAASTRAHEGCFLAQQRLC